MSETALRLGVFLAVLAVLALAELVWPRRTLAVRKLPRWSTNLSITLLNSVMVRAMAMLPVPLAGTVAAVYAGDHGFGILNWTAWPAWLEAAIAIIILDLAIWLQHVATHKIPALWRLHQVHHADREMDVTTAIRFHPLEIALSVVWKAFCVLLIGAPVFAVLVFEIILNGCAMFSHANIRLGSLADRFLRWVIVTPDMHRVHHSVIRHERDSNYGFNLSVWDRLFGTYRAQPEKSHDGMTIGLLPYQTDEPQRLGWSLALPFRKPPQSGNFN